MASLYGSFNDAAGFDPNADNLVKQQAQSSTSKTHIAGFMSQIKEADGLARPTLYEVLITPPKVFSSWSRETENNFARANEVNLFADRQGEPVQNFGIRKDYFEETGIKGQDYTSRLRFMCKKAELPSISFSTSDARTYGSFFKIPYVDTYTDLVLEFTVGSDMFERKFFDAWRYTIQDPETADFNYIDEYATTIEIKQMDAYNVNQYGVMFYQAWPVTIGALQLGYDSFNQFHILPVTFSYRKWISTDILTGTPKEITNAGGMSGKFESIVEMKKK